MVCGVGHAGAGERFHVWKMARRKVSRMSWLLLFNRRLACFLRWMRTQVSFVRCRLRILPWEGGGTRIRYWAWRSAAWVWTSWCHLGLHASACRATGGSRASAERKGIHTSVHTQEWSSLASDKSILSGTQDCTFEFDTSDEMAM